ncbi:glycosyltransferase family 29 protein [Aquibium sp. ELW1220]|uniref:glycosyltransferase family 29 protein n=1 Tax=Aquibium sp. ELW1220 TaxID=2976766 RepID=UPI0025AF7F38|nr:glycosyltransferase family 29 protein [Aquibium sp. ELW1220]MDN2582190.1 glycosyltransferase family 29 protein [Aquibium sp. ELW1220]
MIPGADGMPRYVAIVGNGPLGDLDGREIDGADFVMRFNFPPYGPERGGNRTDMMVLVNSGKLLGLWFRDPAFLSNVYIRGARRVILPWHPDAIRRWHPTPKFRERVERRIVTRKEHWTRQAFERFGRMGKEVSLLPASLAAQCFEDLQLAATDWRIPSTGFLGIRHALHSFPDHPLRLFGFIWEGWEGHDWAAERTWLARQGRVRMPGEGNGQVEAAVRG